MDMELVSKIHQVFMNAGWDFSRVRLGKIRWMTASKRFESAGGGRTAVLYLRQTEDGGIYVHGTYESAGEDVLSGLVRFVPAERLNRLVAILKTYLEDATRRIDNSWGRRVRRIMGTSEAR